MRPRPPGDDDGAGRPGRVPEHFISWEQIAPLVREGMTFAELGDAVFDRLNLGPDYYLYTTPTVLASEPLRDVLKRGVFIHRKDRPPKGSIVNGRSMVIA